MTEKTKACSECGALFAPYRTQVTCDAACQRERGRRIKREKYLANAEAVKQTSREYRRDNPEKIIEMRSTYRKNNLEKIRAASRRKYWEDPESRRAFQRQNRKDNPDYLREANRRRRAKLRDIPSERYSDQDILDKFGTLCHLCLGEIDLDAPRWTGFLGWERGLHLDHVVPISRGGSDLIENIRPSHGICNVKKHCSLVGLQSNADLGNSEVERVGGAES